MSFDLRDAAVIDFETLPITNRPVYPPEPVGVALRVPGKKARYLAWAHPTGGNNCTWGEARQALSEVYDSGRPLVFHNKKFDVDVAEARLGLPRLTRNRYHDTLPMLFLLDPRATTYALKPSSEKLLNMPPQERDAIEDWLMQHQPVPGVRLSRSRSSKHYVGAYIAWAPVNLVGPYAIGDVDRTYKIADAALKQLKQRRMLDAYDLENDLIMDLLDMERVGVRVDVRRLGNDIDRYDDEKARLEKWLVRRLRCDPEINWGAGEQVAQALIAAKVASMESLGVTATGRVQTNKEALDNGVTDPQVLAVMRYRVQLGTCLNTFMKPWYEVARYNGGLIYTTWHSTRTDHRGGDVGTRTGRLSSTPNFQNIPKEFKEHFRTATNAKAPRPPFELLPLPQVRSYVVPYEKDHVLLDRDYSQQELRILAHFEGGALLDAYVKDPWMDTHEFVRRMVNEMLNASYERKPIKNTVFGLIYGMGLGKLAMQNNLDIPTSKQIRDAILALFPGIKDINREMKERAKAKQPIRTWGGREYFCEPPKWVDGELRTYDYKLINVLVQGSAADCTKRAVQYYRRKAPTRWPLLLNIHDQLTVSAPKKEAHEAMALLKEAMEHVQFAVPMYSEGSWGPTLADLKDYDKKGKRVARAS